MWSRDRRMTLLQLTLAGVDVCWTVPLFCMAWPGAASHLWQSWGLLFGGTVLWGTVLQILDWLSPRSNAPTPSPNSPAIHPPNLRPNYPWLVLFLLIASSFIIIHDTLFTHIAFWNLEWLRSALFNLTDLDHGLQPETTVLLTNLFLWLRASWATNRNLTTLGVGNTFKVTFVLLLLASLATVLKPRVVVPMIFVPAHLALGMIALTLAQGAERALRSQASGPPLPFGRIVQFLGIVGAFLALAWVALTFLPRPIQAVLGWVPTVAEGIFVTLQVLLVMAVIASAEFGRWIGALLGIHKSEGNAVQITSIEAMAEELRRQLEGGATQGAVLPPWALLLLRFTPLVIGLVIAVVAFWLITRRTQVRNLQKEKENADGDFDQENLLQQGLAHLRSLANMIRRFGVSRQLLAAISVQNIYANLCRLAAQAGYPRTPSMPPEAYLPVLITVFAGHDAALSSITDAYMRVHYGDHPLTARELAALQADYRRIRKKGAGYGTQETKRET
ncbi:MAG: DUF4129 domain-containing protein [Anaerolineae bacterium]|nr:DUF4129 domain-containing protein [Anaerolineae bacterium]